MRALIRLLQFRFIPFKPDLALLVLRAWFGFNLFQLHGWSKLANFAERADRFSDPLGVGPPVSLALAIFGEVVCSVLLMLGLCTRLAALGCGTVMFVAFYFVDGAVRSEGELSFMYLGAFVGIFIAGPGRFSLDARTGAR